MVPRKTYLRNFWPDLEILETFLTGVKVLFSGDFGVLKAHYFVFFLVNGSQSLRFVVFLFPFGLWESNFSLFVRY